MMVINIGERKVKKAVQEIEEICSEHYSPDNFCLFGQILTKDSKVILKMGSFNKEEYDILNGIINNRKNKDFDVQLNDKISANGG